MTELLHVIEELQRWRECIAIAVAMVLFVWRLSKRFDRLELVVQDGFERNDQTHQAIKDTVEENAAEALPLLHKHSEQIAAVTARVDRNTQILDAQSARLARLSSIQWDDNK